ncbi:MAG: chalcone isomerase family protein [Thermoanaerobaculia bacterium]|nr:chalcone isomerase family protein [Thermoanaerobaculia bacterium]
MEGKDFADALFAVWLGKYPVDEKLKDGMLGM